MNTLCINNGLVIDPESCTARLASVGVKDGRIAEISDTPLHADTELDAAGHVVCPGFIDVHAHVDNVTTYPDHETCAKLSLLQGVTTLVSGNCGLSVPNVTEFFDRIDKGYPLNHAELLGGSTLRKMVGACNIYAPATKEQIDHMCCLARQGLSQGAAGISLGVGYTPGTSLDEILALATVAREYGRVVSIDTRMEDDYDLSSLADAIEVSRRTGVRIVISHLVYQYGEFVMREALDMLDKARAQGVDIWADSGMYVDWATSIGSECFRESYVFAHESILPSLLVATGEYTGQRLDEPLYRTMRTLHPNETVICKTDAEPSIALAFTRDYIMPSSDTAPYNPGEGHPQIAGTFAAFFRMVREQANLNLCEAVRRATLLPAQVMGFARKGRMRVGADADIAVFDPKTIYDNAAYVDKGRPDDPPEGIDFVLVGGTLAVRGKEVVNAAAGRSLKCCRCCSCKV